MPGDGPTPAPTARPSQLFATLRPASSQGARHGEDDFRARRRGPSSAHGQAGRAGLSGPQAASRDRAGWAGLLAADRAGQETPKAYRRASGGRARTR